MSTTAFPRSATREPSIAALAVHPSRRPTGEENWFVVYHNLRLPARGLPRWWKLPLAGTAIYRRSLLLPASERLGRPVLQLTYQHACALSNNLNAHLRILGMPGSCYIERTP